MRQTTEEKQLWYRGAENRARGYLKVGDKLRIRRCGGMKSTVTMTGWDGHWITSKRLNDIHAVNVEKVNGVPVNFGAA